MRVLPSFLVAVLLAGQVAHAQPDTLWSCRISYGSPGPMINGATALADGGMAIVGVNNPEAANMNMFIVRISPGGQVGWIREFGDAELNEQANGVAELSDGTLVMAGYSGSGSTFNTVALMGVSADGDSLWSRGYYGNGMTKGNDITALGDGNFAACGYRLGSDGQHSDAWLLKCRPDGDTLWTRMFGGDNTDIGGRIRESQGGNLVIGGHTQTWGEGDYDFWLLRTDAQGNQLSSETFGTAGQEICYGMFCTDSSTIIAGRTQVGNDNDGYLAKADAFGSQAWVFPYTNGLAEEQLRGVVVRDDGSLLCVGWSGSTATSVAPWFLVVNADGAENGSYVYSAMPQGRFLGIEECASGGQLVYGIVVESGIRKGYVMKIPPARGVGGTVRSLDSGEPLSGIRVGLDGTPRFAVTDARGRFLVSVEPGQYDVIASGHCISTDTIFGVQALPDTIVEVEFDLGTPQYVQPRTSLNLFVHNRVLNRDSFVVYNTGSGPLDVWASPGSLSPPTAWLTVSPSHAVVAAGDSVNISLLVQPDTTDDGIYDYFGYLELRANSCPDSLEFLPILVTVLDAPERSELPARRYTLFPNYPNPFNPTTTISFELESAGHVTLQVYDVTGREVAMLIDDYLSAGDHHQVFEANSLPSGIYLCRLTTGDFTDTKKMILLK